MEETLRNLYFDSIDNAVCRDSTMNPLTVPWEWCQSQYKNPETRSSRTRRLKGHRTIPIPDEPPILKLTDAGCCTLGGVTLQRERVEYLAPPQVRPFGGDETRRVSCIRPLGSDDVDLVVNDLSRFFARQEIGRGRLLASSELTEAKPVTANGH